MLETYTRSMWEPSRMETGRVHTELRGAASSSGWHFSTRWRWEAWALLSLYTCDQTRPPLSPVLDARLLIWFPCLAWWPLPTHKHKHTHTSVLITQKTTADAAARREYSGSDQTLTDLMLRANVAHAEWKTPLRWSSDEQARDVQRKQLPVMRRSVASCRNTARWLVREFDATLKRALRLAEAHLMFSVFHTSIPDPAQPNLPGAGAFIRYTRSAHRRGVPLPQPITASPCWNSITQLHAHHCFQIWCVLHGLSLYIAP